MSNESRLSSLIEEAYAAALTPTSWSDWAWQVTELLGGRCGALNVVHRSGRLDHQTIRHDDMQMIERYIDEEIWRFDPQIPYAMKLQQCCVYTDTDHLDPDDAATAKYLLWQRSNGGVRHYVTAASPLYNCDYMAGLSIHYDADQGPISSANRAIMAALLPHFARAVALGFAHAEKLTAAYWNGLVGNQQEPCALLAEDGKVLRTTAGMDKLLSEGDGLSCRGGRLVQTCGGLSSGLAAALAAANTKPPSARSCRIARSSGRNAYVATVYPLPRDMGLLVPLQATALITIVDPSSQLPTQFARWREAFAFSPRECELAALLMAGHSIGSAAAYLAINDSTARVHLRNIYTKAQVSRQSSLVRLLSRCP